MVRTRSWSISVNPVSPCFINSSTTNYLLFSYRSSSLMQRCCVFCRRPWTALDQQFFSPHLPSRAKNARASARRLCVYMGMWTVDGRLVAGCYLSMHQSVYLHICLSIYLSVCLPSCLSIYVHLCTINSSTEHSGTTTQEEWPPELILLNFGLYSYSTVIIYYVPVHTSIFPSIHPSVRPSVRLSICLSVCLSIYLSINPSVDLSTYAITDTDFLLTADVFARHKENRKQETNRHTHTEIMLLAVRACTKTRTHLSFIAACSSTEEQFQRLGFAVVQVAPELPSSCLAFSDACELRVMR